MSWNLPVPPPVSPMLAELVRELPTGDLLYEPKWDGFRCIVFRDGDRIELGSRNEKPLTRYFPELVEGLRQVLPPRIVLDGEIVIAVNGRLEFEALLLRIHPAASRVKLLAGETPSQFVAFDILALGDEDLRPRPLRERRARLEQALGGVGAPVHLTPATTDPTVGQDWFHRFEGAGLDGVIAKPLDSPYVEGKRVLLKVKHQRTADCVVGGYRVHKSGDGVGSLLLGVHDDTGVLHHIGVASGMAKKLRAELLAALQPLRVVAGSQHPWVGGDVVTQRIPGGPSRWTGTRDLSWEAVRPERVAEVSFDHLQGERFRHATHFLRWRDDRDPLTCTYDQFARAAPEELGRVFGA